MSPKPIDVPKGVDEPDGAFPYRPPDDALRTEFFDLFLQTTPIPMNPVKAAFDKIVAAMLLLLALPVVGLLALSNHVEGILVPANRGQLFFFYYATSQGKRIKKYKIRCLKAAHIDQEKARQGLWHAYAAEWNPEARTRTGSIVKKYYLDEIPQLYNVLRGDLTLVGPRALSCHHYERDLQQGNVTRRLTRGGLLGPTQAMKGTARMGDPRVEYEYVRGLREMSSLGILWRDIGVIGRCIKVILAGKGL